MQKRRWLDADMATDFATIYKVNIDIWMVDVASGGYRGFYVSKHRGPFRACDGAEHTIHILYKNAAVKSKDGKGLTKLTRRVRKNILTTLKH
jgi:hypothetical protein